MATKKAKPRSIEPPVVNSKSDPRVMEGLHVLPDANSFASLAEFQKHLSKLGLLDIPSERLVANTPVEFRSRAMTKAVAVRLHNGGKHSNPTLYFDRLINNGQLAKPLGSGQKWVFDIRDFPPSTHEKLR